jgi:hypothetical protein
VLARRKQIQLSTKPRLVALAAPIWLSGEVQDIAPCGVAIMKPQATVRW